MSRDLPPGADEASDIANDHVEQGRHRLSFHHDAIGNALRSIHVPCFLRGVSEMTACGACNTARRRAAAKPFGSYAAE